ncbi:MAG: GNAT family N-acetyltransferase [Bacteroidia bacterium]|nr:GNAT family N-acetyltransferase [Bacteroidia bacterium]
MNDDIHIHLNDFFDQYVKRWGETITLKSLFNEQVERRFYKRLCIGLSGKCWLRFTRIVWNDRSIAFHFGYNYSGFFSWYKPSFDISLTKRSPGEVLLRQLIL